MQNTCGCSTVELKLEISIEYLAEREGAISLRHFVEPMAIGTMQFR